MSKAAQVKAPWLNSRDPGVPATLTYSELSMCGRVEEMVRRYPDYIAYEFMGKCTTYAEMWKKINACAKSLKAIGIRAHYFNADTPKNRFPVEYTEEMEEPFEWIIEFRFRSAAENAQSIWWRVTKDKRPQVFPDELGIAPANILLLY